MTQDDTSKIAIVGAGSVGATIAYASLVRGVGQRIALYDVNRGKVEAEVLDLNHGLQFVPMATVEGSDDISVCAGARVIVVDIGVASPIAPHPALLDRKIAPGTRDFTVAPAIQASASG